LAAEIRARFPDADVTMIPSSGGRFEVLASGLPIFEKSKLGRKPKPGEVVKLLEATRQ
jgi:predicted Rdx family selenoprotein